MAIDPRKYDLSLTESRRDRLAFRLEHWLLSPGTSEMAQLRGYLRVKTWRDCESGAERLHAIKVAAKLAPRALRDALQAVRTYGDRATRGSGVSRSRQLVQLWWIRVRHGILPPVYYIFQLYKPGQLRRAPSFFQGDEDDQLFRLLNLRTAPEEAELLLDKARFERWLVDRGFPTVRTLMEFADGEATRSHLPEERLPRCDLFSKPNDSLQGFGTEQWHFEGDGWTSADGRRWTEQELITELRERSRTRGILLQEQLRNHHALAPLTAGTLSTVRVLTLRKLNGDIQVVLASAKIPVGGAPTDHMRLGGVAAPIDLETGRLGPAIRKAAETFITPCERHPDTGTVIEGFQLPHWDSAMRLALSAHEALDKIVCVGWDVAILEDGPVLIEGNDNPGHTSSQWPTGIPLGETAIAPTILARLQETLGGSRSPPPSSTHRGTEAPRFRRPAVNAPV